MNAERIRNLLEDVDRAAGPPRYGPVRARDIRRRYHRRRRIAIAVPAFVAAVLLFGVALWQLHPQGEEHATGQQDRIASLEDRIDQLQAQTDATLRLVQDVLAKERQEQRLEALQAELASIPDPAERLEQQADKTAFTLVYQADRLYRELNQTESAVEAYEQVIRLFPENRWADVARERLSEIRSYRINKSLMEGESPCKPHESRSSV
jgi:tetratricopeptide (TPR) repeat protein